MLRIAPSSFCISVLLGILVILGVFGTIQLVGAQTSLKGNLDKSQVSVGEPFELKYTCNASDITAFSGPNLSAFEVLEGPLEGIKTALEREKVVSHKTWYYTLKAKNAGTFSIPPAYVTCQTQKLIAEAITLKVTAPIEIPKDLSQKSFFVRIEPNESQVFPGQQVILHYRLYTRVDVNNLNFTSQPNFTHFFVKDLKVSSATQTLKVHGVTFSVKTLLSIALFAQQVGDYSVGACDIQFFEMEAGLSPSQRITRHVKHSIPPVQLQVKALSGEAPQDFTGVVGTLKVKQQCDSTNLYTQGVSKWYLTFEGDGDGRRFTPPSFLHSYGSRLEMYEPTLQSESEEEKNGRWYFTRKYEYLLSFNTAGNYTLQPTASWFVAQDGNYQQWKGQAKEFTVKEAPVQDKKPINSPNKEVATSLPWNLIAILGLSVLSLGLLAWMALRKKQAVHLILSEQRVPAIVSDLEAWQVAATIKAESTTKNTYHAMLKAMRATLNAQSSRPSSMDSKEETDLFSLGWSESEVKRFKAWWQRCELATFAGLSSNFDLEEDWKEAQYLRKQLQKRT